MRTRRKLRWHWEYTGRKAEEVWDLLLERGAVCRYIHPGLRQEAIAQEYEELLTDDAYWAGAWIRGQWVASALFPDRGPEPPVFVETYDPPPRRSPDDDG